MANDNFKRDRGALEQGIVDLFAKVTFGSTGAPTLSAAASKGIKSITRNGAGDYTITLSQPYLSLLCVKHVFDTTGTSAAPASPSMYIKAQSTKSGPTLRVVFNAAGTATDPASGEVVYLHAILKNSNV